MTDHHTSTAEPRSPEHPAIEPTPFEPVTFEPLNPTQPHNRWPIVVIGALLLILLAVVLWLPNQIEKPERPIEPAQPQSTPSDTALAPWQQAELNQQREAAQQALQQFAERKRQLEAQGVARWGSDALAQAVATVEQGDAAYRGQQFTAAQQLYHQASEALQQLLDSIPRVLQNALQVGEQALLEDDATLALDAFTTALAIDPNASAAQRGAHQAETLPERLQRLQQGDAAANQGEYARALTLYRQGAALAEDDPRLAEPIAAAEQALTQQQFQTAMSEGLGALAQGEFNTARRALQQAQQLKPNAPEVSEALLQLESEASRSRIATLQRQAKQAEQQEAWREAANHYRAILSVDATLQSAQQQLEQSERRATLDQRLQQILAEPLHLQEPKRYRAATALLRAARQLTPAGPRLQQQLQQLQQTLTQARTPLEVTLRSDGETRVTLLKHSALGQFQQQRVALIPGHYTAIGQRNGYRDVRHSFTVSHQQPPEVVVVQCQEPI